MKTFLFSALFISSAVFAQESNWCGTTARTNQLIGNSNKAKNDFEENLNFAARKTQAGEQKSAAITVPVVVHIIHDNGIGNISDEQIFSAIEVLNIDYRRENSDTSATRDVPNAPFKSVAEGMDIEFVMARIDPWGNCTNGIVRVNAPHLTYNAGEDCKYSALGGSDAWPKDMYMNIWVVNTIDSDGQGITAGYAYYPYGAENNDGYGILMDDNYMGTLGTAQTEDGRVLTHEMGHALGLPHIFDEGWGNPSGCHTGDCFTEGDRSCDTPPQAAADWSCAPTLNTCSDIPVNDAFGFDAYDQIENYMSYNSCQNMFSSDQCNIMTNNLNDISFLSDLISPSNMIATGVLQPEVFCKADFTSYKRVICVGGSVEMEDYSFSNPISWSWTVSPGTEGIDFIYISGTDGTSDEPEIQFLTPGSYSISLTAGDGVTSDVETKNDYIRVLTDQTFTPFLESFEPFTTLSASNYWLEENDGGNEAWEVVTNVGRTGQQSVKLANYGQPAGNIDELISSPVDLSSYSASDDVTLTFRFAYRKRTAGNEEWLKVFLTKDCGDTWVQRKTLFGDQLSTLTAGTAWSPSSESDWTTIHMTNVTSSYFVSNFRYKFRFESDGGNNIFIDDINIYAGSPSESLVGLNELISADEWNVYPNPVEDQLNIEFYAVKAGPAEFELRDINGRMIESVSVFAQEGRNVIEMSMSHLSSGVYLVVPTGSESAVKRVIK